MNKLTKAVILGTVAVASLASTFEAASAGERFWRNRGWHDHGWRYHNGPGFRNRALAAGVIGLTAGVIVGEALADPPVVYRERPDVVVDESTVYDEPEAEYVGPADDYAQPDDQDYVAPRNHRRVDQSQRDDQYQGDDQGQMDEQAEGQDYFPNRPDKHHSQQRDNDVAQGALEPWTAQWRSYCKQRFSSFNATTGTYKGYDGKSHFCTSG